MNKIIKKVFLMLIIALMFPLFTVSAYTPKDLSLYAKELNEAKKQIVEGGIEVKEQQIATVFNGVIGDKTVWNNHTVQYVTTPKANTSIKPVVWSAGTLENWAPKTIFEIASDYEKTHPGYIVAGAINGDFYYNKVVEGLNDKTYEPCNYHVQEGDVLRASYYTDDENFGLLGFTDAGYVTSVPKKSDTMFLKKIGEDRVESLVEITGYDVQPSIDGTYVFSKDLAETVDLTGYTVYKCSTELYRKFNEGLFVKGQVSETQNVVTLDSVEGGSFYIATKDVELSIKDNIKVEYDLVGDVSVADNVIGYIYQCLQNGKTLGQNMPTSVLGGYLTKPYTRAAIGFKADGTIVLMTVDGSGTPSNNREGSTLFQTGELLRVMGCVDGFNLDGGGSATLAARINGRLTLINNPSDGSTRKVGNAILLVMPDPKIKVQGAIGNTITITKNNELLENVKVKFNNKIYDMTTDELVVSGLDKNTEYKFKIEYDIKDSLGVLTHGVTEDYYITTENFVFPVLDKFEETKLDENSVTFKYDIDADSEDIVQIYIKNGLNKIVLEDLSGRVTIDNLNTKIENKFILVVELKGAGEMELGTLKYEANSIPTTEDEYDNNNNEGITPEVPQEEKSGCKKDLSMLVISLIGLGTLIALFRKKK